MLPKGERHDDNIMHGHSIQQIDGRTVIIAPLGHRWHEFDGIVPMDAAKAVIEAYRAGYEAGVKRGNEEKAGQIRAALGIVPNWSPRDMLVG